jgi:hypothetical protein
MGFQFSKLKFQNPNIKAACKRPAFWILSFGLWILVFGFWV